MNTIWRVGKTIVPIRERALVMAILNTTPDSFSDGNLWFRPERAVEHGVKLLSEGADILDVGGESTRPGAVPIAPAEEQGRVLPVIRELLRRCPGVVISIDTYHAETAKLAVEAGAAIVNDVSGGLWDARMRSVWRSTGCGVVLMHTRGRPQEWSSLPRLPAEEVVPLVLRELGTRTEEAVAAGIRRDAIVVDPGFGFGKMGDENFALLAGLDRLQSLRFPVVAGVSRKGFLRKTVDVSETPGHSTGEAAARALRDATLAANTAAVLSGAQILRVHDVAAARTAIAVAGRITATRTKFPEW